MTPFAKPVTTKLTALPTQVRMAMSRVLPSRHAQGALLPWDDSHRVPQLHRQSVSGVTAEGKPFQDDLLPPGSFQTGSAG